MSGPEVLAMRQRLELSQAELAEKLGVSERTVRRWEQCGCPEVIARILQRHVENF